MSKVVVYFWVVEAGEHEPSFVSDCKASTEVIRQFVGGSKVEILVKTGETVDDVDLDADRLFWPKRSLRQAT